MYMKKIIENIFYYHKLKILIIILALVGLVTDMFDAVRYLYVNHDNNRIIYIAKNHLPWVTDSKIQSKWKHWGI